MLHGQFCAELLKKCKAAGINTCVETALFVPYENIAAAIPYTDYFYADLKIPDTETHKKYTGVDNRLIIENLQRLTKAHNNVTVRIPLIPGVNDDEADMPAFADIINTSGNISGIELLAYNYLAKGKYTVLGQDYVSFGENAQTDEHKQRLANTLKASLTKPIEVYFR